MVDGWSRDKAFAEADTVGAISDAMRKWAVDYFTAHGKL